MKKFPRCCLIYWQKLSYIVEKNFSSKNILGLGSCDIQEEDEVEGRLKGDEEVENDSRNEFNNPDIGLLPTILHVRHGMI